MLGYLFFVSGRWIEFFIIVDSFLRWRHLIPFLEKMIFFDFFYTCILNYVIFISDSKDQKIRN
jgi:hypothetical protein